MNYIIKEQEAKWVITKKIAKVEIEIVVSKSDCPTYEELIEFLKANSFIDA